jgi:archaellum biogenesis ATPase FlaH
MNLEFSADVQRFFLEVMLTDASAYVRVQGIYNVENFDRSLRAVAEFVQKHAEDYKTLPTPQQLHAATGVDLVKVDDLNDQHLEWFFDNFEKFCRRQELERAILQSADLIEKGEYEPVETLIKNAVQVGLVRDLGTDYWNDPRSRLESLRNQNGQIPTGWSTLDRMLYGGFNRGELEIVAAQSGGGKSLVMQNLAVNWLLAGLNGACVTLELSEELYGMRLDSMITGIPSREIFRNIDNLEINVRMTAKKSGRFQIKYMPAQTTVNQIRSYLKELQIQTNKKLDFVVIDYLDLLMPSSVKVNPSDFFTKDKFVAEELRNLAREHNMVLLTASQFNRSSQDEVEFNHAHISGGISKVNTSDNFIGIYTSRAMRERGKYQLQLLKTRNSNGVGQKLDLDFDVNTLRISDSGADSVVTTDTTQQILDKIKSGTTVSSPAESSSSTASAR